MSKSTFYPVFNCPVHGPESQVFCFRAFDEKDLDKWEEWATGPVRSLPEDQARGVVEELKKDE